MKLKLLKIYKTKQMESLGKCKECGDRIRRIGNGNIICCICADRNFGQRLQEWADVNEMRKIINRKNKN